MEWIFTENRFPVLFLPVGKYHFQQLVAECFCAAVVEKQLRNNGLPVPVGRDDTVRLSGRGGRFSLFCQWVAPFFGRGKGISRNRKIPLCCRLFSFCYFTVRTRRLAPFSLPGIPSL